MTTLYYPCVFRCKTAKIDRIVGRAMPKADAEHFLKVHFRMLWIKGDAIPQPKTKMDRYLKEKGLSWEQLKKQFG